jgi:CBS-domain-containing membrane protein
MWADRVRPVFADAAEEEVVVLDDAGWPVGVLARDQVANLEPPTWLSAITDDEDEEEEDDDEGDDDDRELRSRRMARPGAYGRLRSGYQLPARPRVHDLMIPFVPILAAHAPIADAARLLFESGSEIIAIVDPDERVLVGVFTPRELARWVVAQTRSAS